MKKYRIVLRDNVVNTEANKFDISDNGHLFIHREGANRNLYTSAVYIDGYWESIELVDDFEKMGEDTMKGFFEDVLVVSDNDIGEVFRIVKDLNERNEELKEDNAALKDEIIEDNSKLLRCHQDKVDAQVELRGSRISCERLERNNNQLSDLLSEYTWKRVDDELPPVGVLVIALWKAADHVEISKLTAGGEWVNRYLANYHHNPATHWMPIPEVDDD